MKHPIATLVLVIGSGLATGGCSTLGEILDVPPAVVDDVGGAVDAVVPGEPDPVAEKVGEAAGDVVGVLTGNPLLDLLVTTLVGGAAGWFLRKRQQPATA